MAKCKLAVSGVFGDEAGVFDAVSRLKEAGFHSDDISCLLPRLPDPVKVHEKEIEDHTLVGTYAGAAGGALLSGVFGLLAGVGAFAIPGFGPMVLAGPLLGALAGATMGVSMGSIMGALVGLGVTEPATREYEELLRAGYFLVTVHCVDLEQVRQARQILEAFSAQAIAPGMEESADDMMRHMGEARGVSRAAYAAGKFHPII